MIEQCTTGCLPGTTLDEQLVRVTRVHCCEDNLELSQGSGCKIMHFGLSHGRPPEEDDWLPY
jgi:hypothetical protein